MKVITVCNQCLDALEKDRPPPFYLVQLEDPGVGRLTCSSGHRSALVPQMERYELLYHSGALALIDGYVREAVTSIYTALERFLEFYIRVLSLKRGVSWEQMNSAWKDLDKSSERQIGAFHVLYLLENGRPYKLPRKLVELRNKVVHKGYIPKVVEAEKSAEKVRDVILTLLANLESTAKTHLDEVHRRTLGTRWQEVRTEGASTIWMWTLLSRGADDEGTPFVELLATLRDVKDRSDTSVRLASEA